MSVEFRAQCIRNLSTVLLALIGVIAPSAQAHDFWIEPESFQPQPRQVISLRLRVGQDFKGDSVPFFPQKYERYVVAGPKGVRSIPGVLGDDPAGSVTPDAPGLYVIGLHTKPEAVRFDTRAEFDQYLIKEGLERNVNRRPWRLKSGNAIDETYLRCAKSHLRAGSIADEADHILGFPLELIAETRPDRTDALRLQLRYQGQPLAGALVVAFTKNDPLTKLKARTNDQGRVTLALPRSGVWLITSVHMIPAPWFSGYDWKSYWASLTLERP